MKKAGLLIHCIPIPRQEISCGSPQTSSGRVTANSEVIPVFWVHMLRGEYSSKGRVGHHPSARREEKPPTHLTSGATLVGICTLAGVVTWRDLPSEEEPGSVALSQLIVVWRDFQPEEPRVFFVVSFLQPIERLLFVTHSEVGMCVENREDVMMAGAFLELIEDLACLSYVSREAVDSRTNYYAKVGCCTTRFAFFV